MPQSSNLRGRGLANILARPSFDVVDIQARRGTQARSSTSRPWRVGLSTLFTSSIMIAASYAHCETLADAIALAYHSNPTLQRDRAMLEGIDEGVAQARAVLGPTASLQGAVGYDQTRLGYARPIEANQGQAQFSLSQTLYSGGRDALAVAAARADVAAGRQTLRAAEGDLLLTVIQAYADVLRDAASVLVREKSVAVLSDEVAESRAREKDGEITRTDVAQAETQLAGERALLSTARGQLRVSRAAYATAVGQNPGTLDAAPDLPGLPHTVDEAFAISERESPDLMQARFAEVGSADRVRAARALDRPQITVGITGGYLGAIAPFQAGNVERSVSAQVTVTQPLFTNGANGSRIRQALDQNTADEISIEISRRSVVQDVGNAWNQVLVAAGNTALQRDAVGAAQAAFAGMRIEQRAGQRFHPGRPHHRTDAG